MRNNIDLFISKVQAYLKKAFTERALKNDVIDIREWQTGYTAVLSGLSVYPGCITIVTGRALDDAYFSTFSLTIGIGISGDDSIHLEATGHMWEDILEDTIRSDWSLGGACLDTKNVSIESDCVSGVYIIEANMKCEVDLGGYVYKDVSPVMVISKEETSTEERSEEWQ